MLEQSGYAICMASSSLVVSALSIFGIARPPESVLECRTRAPFLKFGMHMHNINNWFWAINGFCSWQFFADRTTRNPNLLCFEVSLVINCSAESNKDKKPCRSVFILLSYVTWDTNSFEAHLASNNLLPLDSPQLGLLGSETNISCSFALLICMKNSFPLMDNSRLRQSTHSFSSDSFIRAWDCAE